MNQAVHIVDSLALGGAQRVLKTYFESEKINRNVHLLALREVDDPVIIDHRNVKVSKGRGRYSLRPLKDITRLIKSEDITIVHCHLFRAQIFGLLIKIGSHQKCRLIFHEHGRVVGRETESFIEAVLFRWFLRMSRNLVVWYACNSEFSRTCLVNVVPERESSMGVLMNPIARYSKNGVHAIRHGARRKFSVPRNSFVIGFAGRLIETKGWVDFLDAIHFLHENANIFFLIAGIGPDFHSVLRRIEELGLFESGRLLGHVHDMNEFFSSLDCFVMPSKWESHGISHLEAQQCGVPIIVTDVPGLSDTVKREENALFFTPGDYMELADRIRLLSHNPRERKRLASEGEINSRRFLVENYSRSLAQIEQSVLK